MRTWLLAGSCAGGRAVRRCMAIPAGASPLPSWHARQCGWSRASITKPVWWRIGGFDDDELSATTVDWLAGMRSSTMGRRLHLSSLQR